MIPDVNEIKALGKFYTLNKQQLYPFTKNSQVILPYIYMWNCSKCHIQKHINTLL